jgi:hypothetical protein
MKLAELQVLHLEGAAFQLSAQQVAEARHGSSAWVIDTCQRTVIVTAGRNAHQDLMERLPVAARALALSGTEAYTFLLRMACGLESRLAGETEVFGQIKESWRTFSAAPSALSRALDASVQRLFRDTKEIRAGHLSGLGSASYGSQVRRLLGAPTAGPTLLIGAGQLARAVAPWLESDELLLSNRTARAAQELAGLVRARHPQRHCTVLTGTIEAELEAWSRAGDVILCIPPDAACDAARITAWQARAGRAGRLVHLGLGESRRAAWAGLAGLIDLTALLDAMRSQSDQRDIRLARARRACAEKGALLALGSDAMRTRGWEDLAAFATISP